MTAPAQTCTNCRTPLPEGALFCLHCGTATPTEAGVLPPTGATAVFEIGRLRAAIAGSYRIERALGEGGMAVVYLAEDLKHHRKVAIKVMRPELGATLGSDRFLREVEIAAGLTHPHILPVFDSGAVRDILYYVMPFVEGESLQQRIQREGQLQADDALRIAREVAEALAYAHERGIVHRDIKPANIMISRGHALVADFGIARAMDTQTSITKTGLAVGTPQYMSPEQASGDTGIDGRTDVYAMGCVLYEMLVGEPPFTGPNAQAIVLRSLTENPRPLAATRQGLPPSLDGVVGRALAKNPADRWQSSQQFADALTNASAASRDLPAAPLAPGRRVSRWTLGAIATAAVVVLGVGYKLVARHSAAAAPSGVLRLAVLPFENRGTADQAFIVDGIADQVRGKLMNLGSFQITAQASSDQYRGTKETPKQIGSELGVDYLLTSTVTMVPGKNGPGRLQVVPELINVKTGAGIWQQTFDADMSDVLGVQAGIATQVAGALGVALGSHEEEQLATRPTQNIGPGRSSSEGRR
ncbi:MAG TPA: protein kinase [Gemmatimonadales bacterium]